MLGILALSVVFAPSASACGIGDGTLSALNARLLSPAIPTAAYSKAEAEALTAGDAPQPGGADIVGMWAITEKAKNNPNGPPDGTPLDVGFQQWHSDGTEILNSSSRPPATGNFCLGVWKKVGPSTYRLTHKVLDYGPNGVVNGPVTIREEVTVDRSGNKFTGVVTIDVHDLSGNLVARINGEVTGVRITPD
jgi:hypothetical protein